MRGDFTGERGLLGIAFDPRLATNRYLYVYHTMPAMSSRAPYNRIVSFTADPQNPNQLKMGSTKVLLDLDPLDATTTNHNGGTLHYGEAGMLYAALGNNVSRRGPQAELADPEHPSRQLITHKQG